MKRLELEHSNLFIKNKFDNFLSNTNIVSFNLLGSFINKKIINTSDIDFVIIINKINKVIFDEIINNFKNCLNKKYFKNYKIIINSTFGPLKPVHKNTIIIHLMIYDIYEHYNHIFKSPFTCFDWERSKYFKKNKLSDLLSVGNLQFIDFIRTKRNIIKYKYEFKNKKISYEKYIFNKKKYILRKNYKHLKSREIGEYAYHIVRFNLLNYYKLLNQKNVLEENTKIRKIINKINSFDSNWIEKYTEIKKIKENKKINFPIWVEDWCIEFINKFNYFIKEEYNKSIKIYFYRHSKTKLNDKSFLGQLRDPEIIVGQKKTISLNKSDIVFCSSLKRSKQTSYYHFKNKRINIDKRLDEINYGHAEGLNINDFKSKYDNIFKKWMKGIDARFPNGENYLEVSIRLSKFCEDLIKKINLNKNNYIIITHNVVLRTLIGKHFKIPKKLWFRIRIKHLDKLEFIFYNNNIIPNISRNKLKYMMRDILKNK